MSEFRNIHVLLIADGGGGLKASVLNDEGIQRLLGADTVAVNTSAGTPHYYSRFPGIDYYSRFPEIDGADDPPLLVDGQAEILAKHLTMRRRLLLHVDRVVVPRFVPGHFEI